MDPAVAVQGLWMGRLSELSSSTIIIYDHLITLDEEIRLIWRSRWSLGKLLFLMSRYYNVFIVIFNTAILFSPTVSYQLLSGLTVENERDLGFSWLRWQAVTGVFVYGVTEIILMLRLYAMYSQSKLIVALMVPSFILVLAAELVILVLSSLAQHDSHHPNTSLPMYLCILQNTWPHSYLYWIPFLAFETLLFLLAVVKGVRSYRDHEVTVFMKGKAMRALEVLIRDSVLYFFVIFGVYAVNTLCWIIAGGRWGEIPVGFCVAFSSVMSQRLLLNIRSNFEERSGGGPGSEEEGSDLLSVRLSALTSPSFVSGECGDGTQFTSILSAEPLHSNISAGVVQNL